MIDAGEVKPTRVRWTIFLLLLLLVSINYIDRASLSVAMPVIAAEFHLSPTAQGLLFSAFFWSYAAMQIPVGLLSDRMRPRAIIGGATMAWGLCQAAAGLVHGFVPLLLTRVGLGIAESPIMPAGAKLNGVWMQPHERARGATLLDGGAPLGTAIGALLIAGLMSETGSWRMAFALAGFGTMAVGALAWWYIRDLPADHPFANAAEVALVQQANAAAGPRTRGALQTLLPYLRRRSIMALFGAWVCNNCVFYGLLTWMPSYLIATQGLNIKAMGGASFLIFFMGFVGELVGGTITDRWLASGAAPNRVFRSMFAMAAAMAMAALFLVAYARGAGPVVALLCVALFFIRWFGVFWSLPARLGAQDVAGALSGMMNFCGNLAGILVPVLVGGIVAISGSYFLALMFFACCAVGLLVLTSMIDYECQVDGEHD